MEGVCRGGMCGGMCVGVLHVCGRCVGEGCVLEGMRMSGKCGEDSLFG